MANQKSPIDPKQLVRWRLILGKDSEQCLGGFCDGRLGLDVDQALMDEALAAIYDETDEEGQTGKRSAGLGGSAPRLAKWLGDIRTYFTEDVVAVIQQDAIERKGMDQLFSSLRC